MLNRRFPRRMSVDAGIARTSELRYALILPIPSMIRIARGNEYCPF